MRAAISLRLLLALTLMGWGQLSFAYCYTAWIGSVTPHKVSGSTGSAASAACRSLMDSQGIVRFTGAGSSYGANGSSGSGGYCYYYAKSGDTGFYTAYAEWSRTGTSESSCDAPPVDPEPPQDCSAHNGKFIIAGVPGQLSGKVYSTPSIVSIDGAKYISAPDGKSRCKPNFDGSGAALCAVRFAGDGTCMPAGHSSSDDLSEGTFVDVTDTSTGDKKCLTFGGKELCLSPDNAGCDVYNGNPWCYQTGDNCGEVNGTFVCFPKTARQCTYANGKMECIETGNPPGTKPPSYIPPTSSDHPYNGGNADGNDKNDPKAPGAGDDTQYVGGGGPPTDLSQTNDELRGLGDKLDESTGLLEDIKDLLTGDGDESGNSDGSAADAEAEGAAVGNQIGDAITTQMEAVDEERNEEVEGVLDELPNQVSQWFGADGSAVGLDFIDNILPTPVACADYVVPFSLNGYTANIRMPVCALMPYKPILEWVIYCLTAIGAWRIGYSALRQEDAKAVKGGF